VEQVGQLVAPTRERPVPTPLRPRPHDDGTGAGPSCSRSTAAGEWRVTVAYMVEHTYGAGCPPTSAGRYPRTRTEVGRPAPVSRGKRRPAASRPTLSISASRDLHLMADRRPPTGGAPDGLKSAPAAPGTSLPRIGHHSHSGIRAGAPCGAGVGRPAPSATGVTPVAGRHHSISDETHRPLKEANQGCIVWPATR